MTTVDRLLRDLVAIDSVNPTLVAGAAGEAAVARRLVHEFEAMGVPVEVQEVAPGRPNVVATLEGRAPGRSLMLCGHIDTVGVAGMAAPFTPVERDGRLYGRGTQDMKSGVAAMVDARARGRRWRRAGGRPGRRRLRRRRRAFQHRRRCAGHALARRRRGRHRADRPRHRRGAQRLRVVRGRDDRPGRTWQPPGRGHRRDPPHGAGARRTRHDRPRAAGRPPARTARHGVTARVDDRRRAGTQQLSRSLHSAGGAAHLAGRAGGRLGRRGRGAAGAGCRPPTRRSRAAPGRCSRGRPTRSTRPIRCPGCSRRPPAAPAAAPTRSA